MEKKRIWLSSPHIGEKEALYVKEAFDTNWIAPVGPHINAFENDLSSILSNYNVAALSSGTAAIHLALVMLEVGRGDEVICPTFTFAATVNPILYQGATPVFIDSEEESWNMCPNLLEEAIQDRIRRGNKPKAIILVHLYGMPANLDAIMNVANNYEIPVIEDAAESLGAKYNQRAVGTFGTFGVFSFNGNKIITTSGGGALISSNKRLIDRVKYLATQARDDAPHYEHSVVGYNYRLSNVLAGIGRGQLEVLSERIEKRRSIFDYYKDKLSPLGICSFLEEKESIFSNRWLTTILLSEDYKIDKDFLRLELDKSNIEVRPLWKPMHKQPVFNDFDIYGGGVSELFFKQGVCLPSGSNLLESDIERVVNNIIKLYEA